MSNTIIEASCKLSECQLSENRTRLILAKLLEIDAQFGMVWLSYDLRSGSNRKAKLACVTLSLEGISILINLKFISFETAHAFIAKLNYHNKTVTDTTSLYRWMRGEETALYGKIEDSTK